MTPHKFSKKNTKKSIGNAKILSPNTSAYHKITKSIDNPINHPNQNLSQTLNQHSLKDTMRSITRIVTIYWCARISKDWKINTKMDNTNEIINESCVPVAAMKLSASIELQADNPFSNTKLIDTKAITTYILSTLIMTRIIESPLIEKTTTNIIAKTYVHQRVTRDWREGLIITTQEQ